jgi:hypothetical protein
VYRNAAPAAADEAVPASGDVELMTEKQILGFEPASRLEYGGDEHSEPIKDHKHRSE